MKHSMRLRHLVAAVGLLSGACEPVAAAAPQVRTQAPGYYRMMLGDFEVTALLDGTHPFPVDEVMTHARPGEAAALLKAQDVSMPVEGSINAYLINTGSRLILIDSGAGSLYGPCCGHLMDNLRAAGYRPEQVDDVYLTHLHRDHVGGVNAGGRPAFPNATVHVSQVDADYWLNRDNEKTAPPFLHSMWDGAIESLAGYVAAARLTTFGPDTDVSPGIRAIPGAGHTPGHTWYVIQSRGQTLVVWGDTVHVAPIQFPRPAIALKYDSDQASAVKVRRAIFEDAATRGYWIAAAHVSFPGIGHVVKQHVVQQHVVKQGSRFEWAPAPYTTWLNAPAPAASGAHEGTDARVVAAPERTK